MEPATLGFCLLLRGPDNVRQMREPTVRHSNDSVLIATFTGSTRLKLEKLENYLGQDMETKLRKQVQLGSN